MKPQQTLRYGDLDAKPFASGRGRSLLEYIAKAARLACNRFLTLKQTLSLSSFTVPPEPGWTTDLNRAITSIDRAIARANLQQHVDAVDELCATYCSHAQCQLGSTAGQLLLLKVSNLLVAKYESLHRHIKLISHPIGLLVDPTNNCGLRCPGCVQARGPTQWDWPEGMLSEDTFKTFLDEHGPFAQELYLACNGEPLLNKDTKKLVKLARRYGLPTFASTSLSIPQHMLEGLVESGLHFLILSIDGATEDVYLRYRRKGSFEQVLRNVEWLVERKRSLQSYTPVMHWQFLVFEHNAHEIDQVTDLARSLGVNQLGLERPYSVSWEDPTVTVKADWQSKTIEFHHDGEASRAHLSRMRCDLDAKNIAEKFATTWNDRLSQLGISGLRNPTIGENDEFPRPCRWLQRSLTMDAQGRIMPCARAPEADIHLVFAHQSDADHFNSPMHQRARQIFVDPKKWGQGKSLPVVTNSPYCERCEHRDSIPDIDTHNVVRAQLRDVDLFDVLSDESKTAITDW